VCAEEQRAEIVAVDESKAATIDRAIVVRKSWQRSLLTFFMAFGPGLIVMDADNDAGAVFTYSHRSLQNDE
jgi:hypothetical protein